MRPSHWNPGREEKPPILWEIPGFGNGRIFSPDFRDDVGQPFIFLKEYLSRLGYDLVTADHKRATHKSWVWFWNVPRVPLEANALKHIPSMIRTPFTYMKLFRRRPDLYRGLLTAFDTGKLVLFLTEPAVVMPENWSDARRHEPFSKIFTWSDRYADGDKYLKYNRPVPEHFPDIPDTPFYKRKLLVNFSANKSSTHPLELYSARRKTIRYFEKYHPEDFDLYGPGWDQPIAGESPYRSWRGTIPHKWELYPHYRFGLCYENMRDEPGYVSEKIFDCLRAGCVPVYWGAANIGQYVDIECFINRAEFKSDADLAAFLQDMGETEWRDYRRAAQEYLHSAKFSLFMPQAFAQTIVEGLHL